jgi:hypothetical protein
LILNAHEDEIFIFRKIMGEICLNKESVTSRFEVEGEKICEKRIVKTISFQVT